MRGPIFSLFLAVAALLAPGCGGNDKAGSGSGEPTPTTTERGNLLFIHHSVGQHLLDHGLRDALTSKSFIGDVNEIYYGTVVSPDTGRPASLGDISGNNTDILHWFSWFNDYLAGILAQGTGKNSIIMFKGCIYNNWITQVGTEPGDPFSGGRTLVNYKAVFRHPAGTGQSYTHDGLTYRPLEDVFAAHPELLFVIVATPATNPDATPSTLEDDLANAARARVFWTWLKSEWLPSYENAHPGVNNVVLFDWFDSSAYANDDPDANLRNLLKTEYRAAADIHPNQAADEDAIQRFATASENVIDSAWMRYPNQW